MVTTCRDDIWAGDRYSTAGLLTSVRARTQHKSSAHQPITLLITSDSRSAARLPTVITLRDRLRAGAAQCANVGG
jgi:hypothetical protein